MAAAAARTAGRYMLRRFSSGGKVLGEEEKAAENVYIKKLEQDKLEKLTRKGAKPEEQPPSATWTSAKPSDSGSSTAAGVSTDKNRNFAVLAGTVAAAAAIGWYVGTRSKKPEEVQD